MKTVEPIGARRERLTKLLERSVKELDCMIAKGIQAYRASRSGGSGLNISWEGAREEWMRSCWPEWLRAQQRLAVAAANRPCQA